MNSLDILINSKEELEMNNYQKKKKDIDYKELISKLHKMIDQNPNIEFKHCYSHKGWNDYITIGNRKADELASIALKKEEEIRGEEEKRN